MAQAAELLISYGHSQDEVFDYTPKRANAFLYFATLRKKREAAEKLSLESLASRGDPKQLKKIHKDLMKE